MTDCIVQKIVGGWLAPVDEEAERYIAKLKIGEPARVTIKRVRNYRFHCKYFALVTLAFEHWEPSVLEETGKERDTEPEKNIDQFRKELTILAGYYDTFYRLNGDIKIEAKSISFASMSEDEFEQLYSNTIDVILKHIFTQWDERRLRDVVEEIVRFAA